MWYRSSSTVASRDRNSSTPFECYRDSLTNSGPASTNRAVSPRRSRRNGSGCHCQCAVRHRRIRWGGGEPLGRFRLRWPALERCTVAAPRTQPSGGDIARFERLCHRGLPGERSQLASVCVGGRHRQLAGAVTDAPCSGRTHIAFARGAHLRTRREGWCWRGTHPRGVRSCRRFVD